MLKYFQFILFVFFSFIGLSQATLFSEDFESGSANWTASGDITPNFWTVDACAGNGSSSAGTNAAYISNGTINAGCTPGLIYENSPSGSYIATYSAVIDATCASGLNVSFDYLIDGISTEDYGQVVYSTNGGVSWLPVGSELVLSGGWSSTSINLPIALDGTTFLLGFQFEYNNATLNGSPLGIDNIIVTGVDSNAPTLTCPTNIDLIVNAVCQPAVEDVSSAIITLSDNCTDSALIVLTQDIPIGTILPGGPGGSQIITLTATDESGNSSQCLITMNFIDGTPPGIICPADTNIFVDASCIGTVGDYTVGLLFSDNCSALANITITQDPPPGTLITGMVDSTMTIYAQDETGNISSCQFIGRTLDTLVATIICPNDTTLYLNSVCSVSTPDFSSFTTAYDNCINPASLTISQSPLPGATLFNDQIITMTVSGGFPDIDQTCTFTAFVVDTISPNIICPVSTDLIVDVNCESILPDYSPSAVVNDNCGGLLSVLQSPMAGSTISGVGNNNISLTVMDASGNSSSCVFVQATVDTIKPVVTCPSNQTVTADVNCFGILSDYTSLAVSTDNCLSTFTYGQSPSSGTTISSSTVVTISSTDSYGNSGTCSFTVSIIDNIAPQVSCPSNQTIALDNNCQAIVPDFSSVAVVVENCSPLGNLVYGQTPIAGGIINAGPTVITLTYTDTSSNTGSCNFTLTAVDQTGPSVSCPANQSIISDSNCIATLGDYTSLVAISDNCTAAGSLIVQQTPVNGTSISANTLITITVTDGAANSNTCQFNALLIDTIQPVVTCPGDQTMPITSGCSYLVPDLSGSVTGSDNCSSFANMIITQNPVAGSSQNGITTVLVQLIDEQGNSSSCSTNLIPDDQSAPSIICPTPGPVDNGSACDFILPFYGSTALVLDNCSNYSIDQTPSQGTTIGVGTTSITLVVTDAGGNTDQCVFDLEVLENEAPIITCPSNVSTCDPTVTYSDPTFSDNCGAIMYQSDLSGLSSGMTFPVGITIVEYTALDSSGNQSTCSFNVEILDYPSSANISEDTILLCNTGSLLINADAITSGSGVWTVSSGQGSFNNEFANQTGVNNIGIGTNVFVWTVSSTSCGTLADSVVVINSPQDLNASTQDTIITCAQSEILLQANTPLYGVGTWSTDAGAIIDDLNSSNTTAQLTNSGWQSFIWTITNLGCPTTSDTLKVLGNLSPTIYTQDTSICLETNELELYGEPQGNGITTHWSVIYGEAQLEGDTGPSTTVFNLELGANIIVYTSNYPGCPVVGDTVVIVGNLCDGFEPIFPTVITPNFDGKNDLFVIANLEKIYPDCHVVIFNRWGSIVFESTGYADAWDGTYKGEPLPMGTYYYHIELNDEDGTVFKGDISIIR